LNVIDEFTWESLAVNVKRILKSMEIFRLRSETIIFYCKGQI